MYKHRLVQVRMMIFGSTRYSTIISNLSFPSLHILNFQIVFFDYKKHMYFVNKYVFVKSGLNMEHAQDCLSMITSTKP